MSRGPLPVGTVLKQRFEIERLIAGGGMAWVYQVRERTERGIDRHWAMKELRLDVEGSDASDEARWLFEHEAHTLVRLEHPYLPQVVAYFTHEGRSYLVMELVRGVSLKKRLDSARAPLLEGLVLGWALQICDVLAYLHGLVPPLIFRDLKPSNIMVTPQGGIRLIDFGIARTHKKGQLKDTLALGSENYAAPEQWGKAQSDARTDIYGLGATMYHLLGNVPPLPAFVPTPSPPLREHNPAVSPALAAVVAKAMARKPEDRYAGVAEMRQALERCLPQGTWRAGLGAVGSIAVGAPAPNMGCALCGEANGPSAIYCRRCGQPLGAARLRIVWPPGVAWSMPIRGRSLLLGRQLADNGRVPSLDLSFYDPQGYVSRRHAVVTRLERWYALSDLGGENGTKLNGQNLLPHVPRALRHRDEIQLGHIKLRFEHAERQ